MLNFIADRLDRLPAAPGAGSTIAGSNNIGTKPIPRVRCRSPASRWSRAARWTSTASSSSRSLVGIAYWFVLGRTRFGFDLRATGRSETRGGGQRRQRQADGGPHACCISGAVAGLVGMPQLLGGDATRYSLDFPAGLGFTGIAIALLGRNNAVGIAFGALLWAFLDSSSIILDLNGISKEIVLIMQGVDRAVGRHRLRAGPPLRRRRRAAPGQPGSWPTSSRPPRRGCRHEPHQHRRARTATVDDQEPALAAGLDRRPHPARPRRPASCCSASSG